MANNKTLEHNLFRGACEILKSLLPQRGWYEDSDNQAASILGSVEAVEKLSGVPAIPPPKEKESEGDYEARINDLSCESHTLLLTDRERTACKECLSFCLKKALLPANKFTANLITEFSLE